MWSLPSALNVKVLLQVLLHHISVYWLANVFMNLQFKSWGELCLTCCKISPPGSEVAFIFNDIGSSVIIEGMTVLCWSAIQDWWPSWKGQKFKKLDSGETCFLNTKCRLRFRLPSWKMNIDHKLTDWTVQNVMSVWLKESLLAAPYWYGCEVSHAAGQHYLETNTSRVCCNCASEADLWAAHSEQRMGGADGIMADGSALLNMITAQCIEILVADRNVGWSDSTSDCINCLLHVICFRVVHRSPLLLSWRRPKPSELPPTFAQNEELKRE